MTQYLPFVFSVKHIYINQKCFFIIGDKIEYLTAFFNSKLFKYLVKFSFPKLGNKGYELSKVYFEKINVLDVSYETNDWFKKKVQGIQDNYTTDDAQEIEDYIYRLYKLSKQEIDIIESIN